MKWFDLGALLFTQVRKISPLRAVILFPLTIVYFALFVVNFLLFFVQYILTFSLEAAGIDLSSGIQKDDDEYVKKSKLGIGIIICIFFTAYITITQACVYLPMGITALWMEAIGVCINKKGSAKFEISKRLLKGSK